MVFLNKNDPFPPVDKADENGLLAVGGELSTHRLLDAYKSGIFPWYSEDNPILWWSPDPRFVLFPNKLRVSKSMKRFMKHCDYRVTVNSAFREVISNCARIYRPGQNGTWINNQMINAYVELNKCGYAKSVEVWEGDLLVGGLYGVDLDNKVFCGESMFSIKDNASKAGFISFIQNTNYNIIDCQIHSRHLESLGAENIERKQFLSYLNKNAE